MLLGEEFVVTRGSWFYEASWQPLEEETAETMEDVHLSLFLGKKSSEFPLDSHTKGNRFISCLIARSLSFK